MKRQVYNWELPKAIEQRLGENTYGRQRAIFEEDHLFIVLHTPPKVDVFERESILFLRKPDGSYFCNGYEFGKDSLQKLLVSYDKLFEEYDQQYRQCESSGSLFNLLEELTPINRAVKNLTAALQSARSHIKGDVFLISMRDEALEIERNFELLMVEARLALDRKVSENAESHAARSQEIAKSQHKFNLLAAITFPLMAIAALMGMNLNHGLEKMTPILFWIIVAMGGLIGVVVRRWVKSVR